MFSWSRNSTPPRTTQGFSRHDHIASYVNDSLVGPSTRPVSKDDSTYDTIFLTKNNNSLILRVHMPPSKPGQPVACPSMTLVGIKATHPWLDNRMRVVHFDEISSEQAWAKSGLKLGQAVKMVLKQFQLNPPSSLEITDPGLQRIQPSTRGTEKESNSFSKRDDEIPELISLTSNISLPPSYEDVLQMSIQVKNKNEDERLSRFLSLKKAPVSFPMLDSMNRQELEKLMNDQSALLEILRTLPVVEEITQLKVSFEEENRRIAQKNLEKGEVINGLAQEVESLQKSLSEKMELFKGLQMIVEDTSKPIPKDVVIQQLQKGKKEIAVESESIASDLANFVNRIDDFREKRSIYHIRAAKIERLSAKQQ